MRKGSGARRIPTSGFSLAFNLFFFFSNILLFKTFKSWRSKDGKAQGLSLMAVASDLKAVGSDHVTTPHEEKMEPFARRVAAFECKWFV